MPNFAQIGYKRVSDDNDYAGTFPFSEAANPKVGFDKISANEYVACYYNSGWWVGLVQDVNCDEKDAEIIFLHPAGPSNCFTWAKRKDVCLVPCMNVICKIRPPTTFTGQTYYLEKEDNEMISKPLN